jgi:hypothetical protein
MTRDSFLMRAAMLSLQDELARVKRVNSIPFGGNMVFIIPTNLALVRK